MQERAVPTRGTEVRGESACEVAQALLPRNPTGAPLRLPGDGAVLSQTFWAAVNGGINEVGAQSRFVMVSKGAAALLCS